MSSITSRDQAIQFLYGRIDYERMSASLSASDFKLDRMRHLLERLENPQDDVPVVHIAGTKGKGSTAAMISSILRAGGHSVGLFTSPHLERYEERIQIDGEMIDSPDLVELVSQLSDVTRQIDAQTDGLNPTFFELTTALAWLWFRKRQVDIAVLEVGLGGRLDSTTVCQPEVCILTTVSRDHMHVLGSRLSEIAAEKAGIIKPGIPVVSGVTAPEAQVVIERVAAAHNAPLTCIDSVSSGDMPEQMFPGVSGFQGQHQQQNKAVAVAAARELRTRGWNTDDEAIRHGLREAQCPVRIEVVSEKPLVVLDAAHNWASAGVLVETLASYETAGRRVLIFATSRDKDVPGLLRRLMTGFDCIILTEFQSNPRAVPIEQLRSTARRMTGRPLHATKFPSDAWDLATRLCPHDGLICVAGSFFLAAELRSAAKQRKPAQPDRLS